MKAMTMPSADPSVIDHPELRAFAEQAVWVAHLEDAAGALEDLVVDLLDDVSEETDLPGDEPHRDEEPLAVALDVVIAAFDEAEFALEERVAAWLAADPEHWPIFRLVVLDPWQVTPGRWRQGVPGWVRTLGTLMALAHFQGDPYGRQRSLDLT